MDPAVSPLPTDPGPMAGPPGLRAFRLLDEALRQGRYLPGDRLPPERDLARGLGIIRTSLRQARINIDGITMQRALNGHGKVLRHFFNTKKTLDPLRPLPTPGV